LRLVVLSSVSGSIIAAILLVAGVSKVWNGQRFRDSLSGFVVLPARFVPAVAAVLPYFEITTGLGVLGGMGMPYLRLWAGLIAMSLFAIFAIAVAVNLILDRSNVSCGCFGHTRERLTWALVARAGLFAGLSALTLLKRPHPQLSTQDLCSLIFINIAAPAMMWLATFLMTEAAELMTSKSAMIVQKQS